MKKAANWARLAGTASGAALLVTAVGMVVATDSSGASVTLASIGGLMLAAAVFSDRIESLEFGTAKMTLREIAGERSALAIQSDLHGEGPQTARLRAQARGLRRLSAAYDRTRQSMKVSERRTAILDELMRDAAELARTTEFNPVEVWRRFDSGETGARAVALGLMQGDERLRDIHCALEAIEHPHNLFEQFHGLVVARMMVASLKALERDWLREAVVAARGNKRLMADPPLKHLSQVVLDDLESV